MKIKKIIVLFSMIILTFLMTACASNNESVEFKYDSDTLIENSSLLYQTFLETDQEMRAFYERSEEPLFKNGIKAIQTAEDQAGSFVSLDDILVVETGDAVFVTLETTYTDGKVMIDFKYDQASMDSYITSGLYIPSEMVASKNVSKKDLIVEGGYNTLMGMGTVFAVLIFISFIISCFKYLPGNNNSKSNQKKKAVAIPSSTPVLNSYQEELVNDDELVAVITAAINALSCDGENKDKLVVRSIRRTRR